MDRENIIKALECCTKGTCTKCPNFKRVPCQIPLMSDALALINSQEQRIKELTEENKSLTETVKVRGETIEKLQIFVTDISEDNRKLTEENENAREKNKWLNEENERLQRALNTDISIVRVSRGSGKTAHLREVGRIKADAIRADTIEELKLRIAMRFGTYTDKDMTPITEVFRLLEQFSKELEGE